MIKQQCVWTALVTPFTENGDRIDFDSFKRLLKAQEAAGNGILLCGSTGEAMLLSDSERRLLVTFALEQSLTVPIMVGVPSIQLPQALNWLAFCCDLPIDAYLLTTPIYTKPGICGQTAWFETLLDEIAAPVMLYNIPSRTGVSLSPQIVKNLAGYDQVWAIKESTGSVENVAHYYDACPNIVVYCGDDSLMPEMATHKAVGLVSVVANAWPHAVREYVKCCLANLPFDRLLWKRTLQLMSSASNPIPIKTLLAESGRIAHSTLRLPLSTKDLPTLDPLLEADKTMMTWEQSDE